MYTRGVGVILLPIPAMVYYINDLDIEASGGGGGRGGRTNLKVRDVLYKICPCNYVNS